MGLDITDIKAYLEQIHALQVEMMLELKRICEKHNIHYFLDYGTMLGAVRHQGFIPWDDDVDFGMFRSEYDRFLSIVDEELDQTRFRYETIFTSRGNCNLMGKMKYRGTKVVDFYNAKCEQNHEVWIDLFIYEDVPDDPALRRKQEKKMNFYKRILYGKCRYGHHSKLMYAVRRVIGLLYPMSLRRVKEKLTEISGQYNGVAGADVRQDLSTKYFNRDMKRELAMYTFEGHEFPGVKDYDRYLTQEYGDWRQMPPEEKRYNYRHQLLEVDLTVRPNAQAE